MAIWLNCYTVKLFYVILTMCLMCLCGKEKLEKRKQIKFSVFVSLWQKKEK